MNTIQIANILVTRRCNLSCSYCNLVRNYPEMPVEYKRMANYASDELSGEEWIAIFDRIVKNNPNVFFVIYGGEPFVYNDLWKIIKHCNDNNIFYTVISNNTDHVQDKIHEVYRKCGQYRGFTSSVDPVGDADNQVEFSNSEKGKFFITQKSNDGLNRLIEMKQNGMVDDAVAEITIMRETIPYLYETVKKLSSHNIYSSITTLDDAKNSYYDFARVLDINDMVPKSEEIKHQFELIKADKTLLIHMPELLDEVYKILPSCGNCGLEHDIHNVTIDADGTFRLCLRIRGTETPKLLIDQIMDEDGKITPIIKQSINTDMRRYCQGCNWTCACIMSKYPKFRTEIIDHGIQAK